MEWAVKASLQPCRAGAHFKVHGYQAGIEFWPLDPWFKVYSVHHGGFEHDTVIGPAFVYCRRISDIQRFNDQA